MATNLRAVPQVMPPGAMPAGAPQQQGWFWNGTSWVCDPCFDQDPPCPPFPCPPPGFPTPCPPWFPPPSNQPPWYPGANGGVSFSATAPPNPIRGNFWWDGTQLHLFDGAAWVSIGPTPAGAGGGGTVVGTTPPANPALGTTWWNGTILQVWDGTVWRPSYGIGVTDGSNAAPGTVGEFLYYTGTVPFTAGTPTVPSTTNATLNTLTIPPGDWNIWAFAQADQYVLTIEIQASPVPSGLSNNLLCFNSLSQGSVPSGVPGIDARVVSPLARGNFMTATLITLAVEVQTTGAAGTVTAYVHARRVR